MLTPRGRLAERMATMPVEETTTAMMAMGIICIVVRAIAMAPKRTALGMLMLMMVAMMTRLQ